MHSVRSGTGDERSWFYLLEECSGLVEQPVRIGSVTSVMQRPRLGQVRTQLPPRPKPTVASAARA